jgi:hypothetical protein
MLLELHSPHPLPQSAMAFDPEKYNLVRIGTFKK